MLREDGTYAIDPPEHPAGNVLPISGNTREKKLSGGFVWRALGFFFPKFWKEREELLSENEMLRLVAEGVGDGLWDWDLARKKISFSPRWLEMFGYRREGFSDDPAQWLALAHPDDVPALRHTLSLHLEGRSPFFHIEYRLRMKSGAYRFALTRGRAVFDAEKKAVRMAGSTTDISHIKAVEDALKGQTREVEKANSEIRSEKAKGDAMLASIGEGLIATDKGGRIILMNEPAAMMLQKSARECVRQKFTEAFPKEGNEKEEILPEEMRVISRTLSGGEKISAVAQFIRPDGRAFPAAVTSSPIILDGAVFGAVLVFRDITKEREIDRAKTEFVSLASHQLRTPLSAIRWYSEMLVAEKIGQLNENQRVYMKEIYRSNVRMIDLVNSFLNVSRIDLGTFAVDPKETDIREIAESVLLELSPKIQEKKMAVERVYESGFPKMMVDPKLMRIIFQNYLSNAVKYTPESGKVSLFVGKSAENPEMMRIAVEDTGVGIPEDSRGKVFTKLFRADNARAVESEGTGLGLYIVKAIAEKSGGRAGFQSPARNGTGSLFFAEIPMSGMKRVMGAKDLS